MELRQLRYFVKVCELGSMGRAALELELAASALSQQISRLEGELSRRLLNRGPSGVTPTDAGLAFLPQAQFTLRHADEAVRAAQQARLSMVHKGVGVKTLGEFVALAKKKPGSVDYASTGASSASHLAGELFNQRAGIEMVHVPYKGGAPALQDLLGERVTSYFSAPPHRIAACGNRQAHPIGHYRPHAPELYAQRPDRGGIRLRGFEALNWYAFVAPAKTPAPMLDRWNAEVVKVLNDPGVRDALNKHGLTPQPTTRAELAAFMKKEDAKWGAIVQERKITAN